MENTNAARLRVTEERTSDRDYQRAGSGSNLSFTGRIANWSARHRWWVVGASLMVVVMAFFVLNSVEMEILDYDGEGESVQG